MNNLINSLASLKLAVILLVLLLLGLATGTIIESSMGTEVAGRVVYYSAWFIALQVAFAINVLASIIQRFPWGTSRVGFLITHGALLLILVGAGASFFFKVDGQIMLWEGETGNEIANHDRDGRVIDHTTLPFAVKLDDFRIDYYQGTKRPANFRSDVQIVDPGGATFKAAIWMNHELEYKGWRLFQSSYQQEKGREATVLSVSKDPGQLIVFIGYILLVVGMCIVLGTRAAQSRGRGAPGGAVGRTAAFALIAALGAAAPVHAADSATEALKRLPVQHDGRVMPLDTLAREAVWNVTGKRTWDGADAVTTATSWTVDPSAAANAPIVLIGSSELAAAVGLPAGITHASFAQLVNNHGLMQMIDQARHPGETTSLRKSLVTAADKIEDRLLWLQGFLDHATIQPIPPEGDVMQSWGAPATPDMKSLLALATGPRLRGWPLPAAIDREVTYNAVRPTRIAWIVLFAALVISIFAWNRSSVILDSLAVGGLAAGFVVMTWGIAMRWVIADRIPAANMFESLLFLAWGVGLFAVVAFVGLRNRIVVLNANAMAALTMALTDLLPIDAFIHPVAPVLAGTPWLAIHVPIIMVSYSVLALGVVIAHMQLGFTIFAPKRAEVIERMSELLYWYIMVGSILLIAGILTGSMWAASSWGRYWGWDPKEVWSLVAFLAYLAIVHARWDGMLGPFGVAAMSVVAFQTILMTYLGVNYVLATGMHSYGFGDSPVLTWMIVVATADGTFLVCALIAQRRQANLASMAAPNLRRR